MIYQPRIRNRVNSVMSMCDFFGVSCWEFQRVVDQHDLDVEKLTKGWLWAIFVAGLNKKPEQWARAEALLSKLADGGRRPQISATRRQRIYARDGHRCRYCGKRVRRGSRFLDHMIPYSRGGTDLDENLVSCCRRCNYRKGARTPEEAGMALLPLPNPELLQPPDTANLLGSVRSKSVEDEDFECSAELESCVVR